MSEVWPIYIAKTVRRSGMFNISIQKGKGTTSPRDCAPTIPMIQRKQRLSGQNSKQKNIGRRQSLMAQDGIECESFLSNTANLWRHYADTKTHGSGLRLWLQRSRIHSPRQLSYRLGVEYVEWRINFKKRTGKIAGRNTAILELKLLSLVMGEAVRLGHADANPLVSMKIRKEKPAKKPELTDTEILEIREALFDEPEWMQISFEISLNTGCRLRETSIPLSCVDFRESKITFPSPKGGEERAFSIPMPTALIPLFKKLAADGCQFTLEFPFQPSRRWQQFFIKIEKEHLCFHCLRVTYVNRLRRAGVPREAAMRLVNHSSEMIHKIYQRERVDDVVQWRDDVRFPSLEINMEPAS